MCSSFHNFIVSFRRSVYGPNLIDVPVKPCFNLLIEEVGFKRILNLHVHFFVFEDAFYSWFTPNFQWNGPFKQFLCFFRCSTHSTFSSWPASSCGVWMIIMFTPFAYSSSQSFPSLFRFMRSVRSVRLTCVYWFPLNMEKIIEILCDLLFCSKASLFTKWPTLSQMSQCWDSRRVSFCVEFDSNLIAIMMTTVMKKLKYYEKKYQYFCNCNGSWQSYVVCFFRGVCELGRSGARRLSDHPAGRLGSALWCCPSGWGVSGEWKHADRWSSRFSDTSKTSL